jgi:cysteine synthase
MRGFVKPARFIDLVGNTPLIDLTQLVSQDSAYLYAKCEFMNPGFSLKDRMAGYILDVAEAQGKLQRGDVVVCASSGNTGCSIAMISQMRGYKAVIITSERCSLEKRHHIQALNAELIVVDHDSYMTYGRDYASNNGYFDVDQYNNPNNPEAYYQNLGPEIWKDTDGKVTHFVMTGSTFGCVSGTGRFLKKCNSDIQVILADPFASNIYEHYYQISKPDLLSHPNAKKTSVIEGAGKSSPTQCLDFSVIDEVIKVTDEQGVSTCHQLSQQEGLLVGGSSGVNVAAAMQVASRLDRQHLVVTILCDNGVKYLSKIYDREFLNSHGVHLAG